MAQIIYDDSINGLTQPYVVVDNGQEISRHSTYARCERFMQWHGYTLEEEVAQIEFEEYINEQASEIAPEFNRKERSVSVQVIEKHGDKYVVLSNGSYYTVIPGHTNHKERCECADCFFRGAKCKHQIAVENNLLKKNTFVRIQEPESIGWGFRP